MPITDTPCEISPGPWRSGVVHDIEDPKIWPGGAQRCVSVLDRDGLLVAMVAVAKGDDRAVANLAAVVAVANAPEPANPDLPADFVAMKQDRDEARRELELQTGELELVVFQRDRIQAQLEECRSSMAIFSGYMHLKDHVDQANKVIEQLNDLVARLVEKED